MGTATRTTTGFRLLKRGSLWSYRRRVPLELAKTLGRVEIVRSLATRSLREARRRATLLDAQVYVMLDVLKETAGMTRHDAEQLLTKLCDDYLRQLVLADREGRRTRRTRLRRTLERT